MVSFIYTILSTISFSIFLLLVQTQLAVLDFYHQLVQAESEEELAQTVAFVNPPPQASTRPNVFIYDQIKGEVLATTSAQTHPIPTPQSEPEYREGYLVEPTDEEGIFSMKNAPPEPMTTVEELNQAVNEFRSSHGLGWLELDGGLCGFANRRAQELEGDFSHDGFVKYFEGDDIETWSFTRFGENIWQGEFMGVHIVEYGWAKSPRHYDALVGDWTKGCGGVYNEYAIFIFGR